MKTTSTICSFFGRLSLATGLIPQRSTRLWGARMDRSASLVACSTPRSCCLAWVLSLISWGLFAQNPIYLTPTGAGNRDGSSWSNSLEGAALQGTLASAPSGTTLLVGTGLYKPTTTADRGISFVVPNGVQVYGGYAGSGPSPDSRTTGPSSTTLSGDIDNDNTLANNASTVIQTGSDVVLSGLVITQGNGESNGIGSGLTVWGNSVTVQQVEFVTNTSGYGGGMAVRSGSAYLTDCIFRQNTVSQYGAGLFLNANTTIVLTNCHFLNNSAQNWGGGIGIDKANATLNRCSFIGNLAEFYGGGMYIRDSNPTLTNCSFIDNVAASTGDGGGIYNRASNPILTNCSFNGNFGLFGGAIFNTNSNPTLTNCIIWGSKTAGLGVQDFNSSISSSTTTYRYTNSQDGVQPGEGNRSVDPLFVDAVNGNLRLSACSPLINAGDNTVDVGTTDLTGENRRYNNGSIDLGAYEFEGSPAQLLGFTQQPSSSTAVCSQATVTASVSVTGTSPTYQWYKEGKPVDGQSSATLNLSQVDAEDAGSYYVVVTSPCNSLTSTAFTLTVNSVSAPGISVSPSVTQPILQNTPFVTLTVTGCEGGTLNWQGPNGASGSGSTIPVSTSATGDLTYSATCQVGNCTSTPANFTVTVSPPLVSGSFDGFINGADCSTFRGWAWDRNKPNAAISVDILDGAKVIDTVPANVFRQDLKDAGKGNGIHAFRYPIPESLKDGQPHNLSARVENSSFVLKDSPKALICEGVPVPGGNKAPVPPSPTVLVAPLTAQLNVPFSGTLLAFTDPENQPLTYTLSGLPDGLAINASSRVISGTPTEAGTFVLAYSASDGQLTNSVSFPLTVNPASTTTVTGSFEGYLDKVECGTIRGWVWDRKRPNTPLTVEFYHATTQQVFGSTLANIYRDDLKNAGKGNGAHAYSFTVPNTLKDGNPRPIMARVLGSTYDLKGGPKTLTCSSPARVSAESFEGLQVTILGNPVSDQLSVEVRGAESRPLRLQLIDASGRLVSQRQIDAAKAIEQQTFSVNQQSAGLLLLRVSSGLKSVTLKILK